MIDYVEVAIVSLIAGFCLTCGASVALMAYDYLFG